ncbi:MAG: nucleoside hydrolase [Planctomycetes bacterium]|nr:nucleoside hydrolase [Planctomycetota bacterium]
MPKDTHVLLDTDIGSDIDDAMCLAYLLAERRCGLLGISTVSGEAPKRAMLADSICRAADRIEVPIWSGCESPLIGEKRQKIAPQAEVLQDRDCEADVEDNEAVWMMRDTIREYPGDITLLTVGPLTNIALLFALDPEIPRMLDRLVVMGGDFRESRQGEWNVVCDPYASAIVFSAPVREIQVHPLDVTTQCTMDAHECRERFQGGPLDLVAEMAEVWFRERDVVTFHDPLAACCVFEPEICSYKRGDLHVELYGRGNLGYTALSERSGAPCKVAADVEVERFFDRYFSTVQMFG